MANNEMNVLKVGNSEFEIADAQARQDCSNLKDEINVHTVNRNIISDIYPNGQLNPAGQVINLSGHNLYIANVTGGQTLVVTPSADTVYAFFDKYPAYGVIGISGRLTLSSGTSEILVPANATYIAVRDVETYTPDIVIKGSIQQRVSILETDVENLENESINISNKIGDLYTITYTRGAYVNDANGYAVFQTTGVSASFKTWVFDCIGYSALTITTYFTSERDIYVTDNDLKILSNFSTSASSATTKTTVTVTIPTGGTKLIIPCYYADGYDISISGITVRTEIDSTKALINSYFPSISDINPCDYDGKDIIVFKKCLCIGDSFTEGGFNADAQDPDNPQGFKDYSYPTVLSRLTGMDVTNMGHGGETAQSWDRTYTSTITGEYDMCIILLGINDCVEYGGFNADSQAALGRIIAKVQSENSHIKIFVSTIPIYPAFDTTAIRASTQIIKDYIASLADDDLYVMDMETNNHLKDSIAYQYGHPTALGYARLAQDYYNYISWIINQNLTDFRWVQFTGTNYTHGT